MKISKSGMLSLSLFLALGTTMASAFADTYYQGVNLGGADFGGQNIPGKYGKDYIWPGANDVDMYADLGANIFRVPFLWDRMQPTLNGPLDPGELGRLDAVIKEAAAKNAILLLDVHSYASYGGHAIGSAEVPTAAFADLWSRLATHLKDQPNVAYGLMNEPNKTGADEWEAVAQAGIDAIRKTGAKQTIMVPGTGWTGAHSWNQKMGASSNGEALLKIKDPANNVVFEAHQYFDADSSGTHATCASEDAGPQRLEGFTKWLRDNHKKGLLGEFGASKDPTCLAALDKTLQYMDANKDVYYGYTYWAAAAWFGDYMFNVDPPDANRFPQIDVLKKAWNAS